MAFILIPNIDLISHYPKVAGIHVKSFKNSPMPSNKLGIHYMRHILDDFLILTYSQSCPLRSVKLVVDTCDYLGIPTIQDKTESSTTLEFLGIELDSLQLQARLPQDKICKCVSKVQAVLTKETVKKSELESLEGPLNFVCLVVWPGRPFMRKIYDKVASVKSTYFRFKVTSLLSKDLKLWLSF